MYVCNLRTFILIYFHIKKEKFEKTYGEMWAIYHGIKWAVEKGFQKLMIETNSAKMINLLQSSDESNRLSNPCNAIRDSAVVFNSISFTSIYREQNQIADSLSRCFMFPNLNCMFLYEPPDSVLDAFK